MQSIKTASSTRASEETKYLKKFNERGIGTCTIKSTKQCPKKLKDIQINWKIFYIHELKDLILFKCPHYIKLTTDSVQSSSKFQGQFCRN